MGVKPAPIHAIIQNKSGLITQVWAQWFSFISSRLGYINNDGSYSPPSIDDADAANNSIYYSTTQSKLVYKDGGGTVNALY